MISFGRFVSGSGLVCIDFACLREKLHGPTKKFKIPSTYTCEPYDFMILFLHKKSIKCDENEGRTLDEKKNIARGQKCQYDKQKKTFLLKIFRNIIIKLPMIHLIMRPMKP